MIDRLFYLLIAGGLGGLLGWLCSEPFMPGEILPVGVNINSAEWHELYRRIVFQQNLLGLFTGLFVGGLIGGASGWSQGSRAQIKRGLLWGSVAGAIAGTIGVQIAATVYSWIQSVQPRARENFIGEPVQLIARALGWGAFGMLLGAGQAVATRSWQRVRQGAIGGLIGGVIGGIAFEVVAPLTQGISQAAESGRAEVGRFSRAVGLVCIGSGIGLFVGLTEFLLRSAWIRVLIGRNEGKEFLVDAPRTLIGRSESVDIPLFGDPSVVPQHAAIDRAGREYVLTAAGPQAPVFVNGQPVGQMALRDGDVMQIGQFQLQFRLKSGQGVRAPVDMRRSAPVPMPSVPANVCPYCGQVKGPSGECACTPVAGQTAPIGSVATAAKVQAVVVMDGPMAGQRFPLAGAIIIGREALGGIQIGYDQLSSRKHAHIEPAGSDWIVCDDGSTNGTFVNGVRISRQPVVPGDVITIGATNFRVE